MTLTFLMLVRDAGPGLWQSCQSLRAVARAGDRIVTVDAGSQDSTAQLLRRFSVERGWGQGVEHVPLYLDTDPGSPEAWEVLARDQAAGGWLIALGRDDHPCAAGLAALRGLLDLAEGQTDLAVLGSCFWLGAPLAVLPCPEAGRGPGPGLHPAAAARPLRPDPDLLLWRGGVGLGPRLARLAAGTPPPPPAEVWETYDSLLAAQTCALFCPEPVLARPLPEGQGVGATYWLAGRLAGLAAAPGPDGFAQIDLQLQRLSDEIALSPPVALPEVLSVLETLLQQLPRRTRTALLARPGPLAPILTALYRGGVMAAAPFAALIAAQAERMRSLALAATIGRLRADLDIALPGADYLCDMFDRLHGPT